MPIFKKSNILFIHIPKTAGSSIEKHLYDLEEENDRYSLNTLYSENPSEFFNNMHSPQHCTFIEIKTIFDENTINNFHLIFTIVRNPFDRMVSEFHFYSNYVQNIPIEYENIVDFQSEFEIFCQRILNGEIIDDNHQLPQYLYLINEFDKIDPRITILRYESIHQDVKNYLNLSLSYHENKSNRPEKCENYYNDSCKKLIVDYYAKDFELFGYDTIIFPEK
jgi:hypothetical protein